MRSRWTAMLVPVLHGAVLMLPIVRGDVMDGPGTNPHAGIWVAVFAADLVFFAIGTVFIIFMLVSERTLAVHKTAASVDPLKRLLNRRGFGEATARMIAR